MKTTMRIFQVILLFVLLAGCLPAAKQEDTMEMYYTSAAETISVALTTDAMQQTLDALARPSATAAPTDTPSATETPLPTATLFPTDTPEVTGPSEPTATVTMIGETPTETPAAIAVVTARTDTACRAGSGYTWPIRSSLLTGNSADVVGRLADNTWWYIVNPADSQGHCWVWAQNVSIIGNIDLIPVKVPEPTPKPDVPDFIVDAFAYPSNYIGKCPIYITLTGYVFVKTAQFLKFEWLITFGSDTDAVWILPKQDGYFTFKEEIFIDRNVNGTIRLKMTYPEAIKSDRVEVKVHCSNKKPKK